MYEEVSPCNIQCFPSPPCRSVTGNIDKLPLQLDHVCTRTFVLFTFVAPWRRAECTSTPGKREKEREETWQFSHPYSCAGIGATLFFAISLIYSFHFPLQRCEGKFIWETFCATRILTTKFPCYQSDASADYNKVEKFLIKIFLL
jgi:hypothetical protein